MTCEMMEELYESLCQLEKDTTARVIILNAEGKAFCVGADLAANRLGVGGRQWDSKLLDNQKIFSRCIEKMASIPQPIIAAVHGACAGGGMSLALAADIRIAAKNMKMNAAFLTIGMSGCELGTSFYLPRLVGLSHASEILMTGDAITASRALEINLVNYVTENVDEMDIKAVSIAKRMLKASPLGLKQTKQQLRAASEGSSLRATLHSEDVGQVLCLNDEETAAIVNERCEPFIAKVRAKM
eukprot:CAMPEP_0184014936 /NCGR_PEP_ID=MMETSP0954-20121128/6001_1 /TAXON_ID=627963 /ORGANISM="Aplanochytrium sp, Strain PBS07" /LENGTH=241 /DNA_ID=CAMNT_0026295603 /DNA_START=72 /DNA_END=797 /DNA_ORIENTATION=-